MCPLPSSENTHLVFGQTRRACDPTWMQNRIKELRIARGWSQEDLARLYGASQQHIHRMETGAQRLNTDHMEKLGAIFEIDPLEVLTSVAEDEAELIGWYRALPDNERSIVRVMVGHSVTRLAQEEPQTGGGSGPKRKRRA